MNIEILSNIEKLYNKPSILLQQKVSSVDEYSFNIILLVFALICAFLFYIKININIDVKNWNIKKCSPKYVFFSGYVHNDTPFSNKEATIMNFAECGNQYIKGATQYQIGRTIGNSMNNFKDYMIESNESVFEKNKKLLGKLNKEEDDIVNQFNKLDKDVSFNLNEENAFSYSLMKNVGIYIDQLNELMEYISSYSKQYLTYKMMESLNNCIKNQCTTDSNDYKNFVNVKNILNKHYGGPSL